LPDAGSSQVRAKSEKKKLSFAAVHAVAGGAIRDRELQTKTNTHKKESAFVIGNARINYDVVDV